MGDYGVIKIVSKDHSRLQVHVCPCGLSDGHERFLVDARIPRLVEGVRLNLAKEERQ